MNEEEYNTFWKRFIISIRFLDTDPSAEPTEQEFLPDPGNNPGKETTVNQTPACSGVNLVK